MMYQDAMSNITKIHKSKTPRRPHYIPEWAERRGYETQAALAVAVNADKSLVSRWYKDTCPTTDYLERLASLFTLDNTESLFRHPDDDWLFRKFQNKSDEDKARLIKIIDAAFPEKDGTTG